MENDRATTPFVSVIVPVRNEERLVSLCLESLRRQEYPKDRFEILVVDNGSSDGTVDICKRYTPFVYVLPDVNISALRNFGARKGRGEIYAFIDGDCEAERNWLEAAVSSLRKERCITGAYCLIPREPAWVERVWSSRAPTGRREVPHLGSANLIVPSSVFREAGGFDPKLKTGEDYEFCTRARSIAKVVLDDSIKVIHHGNPKTIRQFVRRELWHGFGAFGSLKAQKIDKPLIGTIGFLLFTAAQLFGLIHWFGGGSPVSFGVGTAGIAALVIATALAKDKKRDGIANFLLLACLFYFYYFARSLSLILFPFRNRLRRSR